MQLILIPTKEDFVYIKSPFLCGFKLFEQALDVEKAGTSLENQHHSIFIAAHLYNAGLQCGHLQTRWPEIDRLIEQRMDTIFGIAGIPTTAKDMGSRLHWQIR